MHAIHTVYPIDRHLPIACHLRPPHSEGKRPGSRQEPFLPQGNCIKSLRIYIYIYYIYITYIFFCTAISWRIIKDKIKFAILIHTPHKTWPAWSLSMRRISIYNAIWRPHLISTRSEEWELFPSPQTSLHMTVWHTLQLITSHFPEGNALQKATSSSLGWSQQMIS